MTTTYDASLHPRQRDGRFATSRLQPGDPIDLNGVRREMKRNEARQIAEDLLAPQGASRTWTPDEANARFRLRMLNLGIPEDQFEVRFENLRRQAATVDELRAANPEDLNAYASLAREAWVSEDDFSEDGFGLDSGSFHAATLDHYEHQFAQAIDSLITA